jgi:DNA-directed RNA polymerase subunit N
MIIPVRCFTCHKVIGDKWTYFKERVEEHQKESRTRKYDADNLGVSSELEIYFSDTYPGKVLDELRLTKLCCRRHMLSHLDLVDII